MADDRSFTEKCPRFLVTEVVSKQQTSQHISPAAHLSPLPLLANNNDNNNKRQLGIQQQDQLLHVEKETKEE